MSDETGADQRPVSRRDALKAAGLAGAAALSTGAVASAQTADKTPIAVQAKNPYGGVPSGGITFPQYYRPTPYLASNNIYYPGQEAIGPDEMRISFIGSTPIPVTRVQAGTCIMVELGSGERFFFDFGSGCMRNIIAMAVPLRTVNDIFFTHLHVDHYADLPYLFAFAPWMGRWKPLRVHIRPHAPRRHQAHDRGHEDDDPLAHGLFQCLPDGRRLRGRGQRVRFPR
jgi:hypothetical protein